MRKITLTVMIICLITMTSQPAFAGIQYTQIAPTGTLHAYGDSKLTFPIDFSTDRVDCISSYNGTELILTTASITRNVLTISPLDYFEGGATHTIKIITRSGKKYIFSTMAKDTIAYDTSDPFFVPDIEERLYPETLVPSGHLAIKISPKPSKGFHFPYYLLIPKGTKENTGTKFLVVEPNNTGKTSHSLLVHENSVKSTIHANGTVSGGAGGFQVATSLKMPLLVPVFPRPATEDGLGIYTHALDREAIQLNGTLKRIDLQLIAMMENAKSILSSKRITVQEKIFMVGFSASGDFVNRFMFLHPELVKAITSSTSTIFPAGTYKGVTLNYPLGTEDMKSLTGIRFNAAEYAKVAKYIFIGDQDDHDGVTSDWDRNGVEYVSAMHTLFGQELFPDKWNQKITMIRGMGYSANYQYQIYKGIGHEVTENVHRDLVAFFKANSGDRFVKIVPHEYGNK